MDVLKRIAKTPLQLSILKYIQDNWINHHTFKPENWNSFLMPIRTNNDTEAWHRSLKAQAQRCHVPFYLLVELLHQNALQAIGQVKLISMEKLCRAQSKRHFQKNVKIYALWDAYRNEVLEWQEIWERLTKL